MSRSGARPAARASLLLAVALAVAPLLPALLPGRALYFRDVGQTYVPNRALFMRAISQGHLPLWNPQRGCGQPFLANPNSMLLRPTTLIFLPIPARSVHVPLTISVMALCAIAAAGTWLLLREMGLSGAASLIGSAAFSLSGSVQSLGQLQNHLEGVAWIPVTLFAFRRSWERGWRPWGIIAGFFFALVVSGGEPVWIAVTLLAAAALPGLCEAGFRKVLGAAAVTVILGALIASAQILPLAENAMSSARASSLEPEEVLKWSLPPQALLQTALPDLWGDPSRTSPDAYWGSGLFDTSLPWLLSIHLGAPIILLAVAGAKGANRKLNVLTVTAAAAGVLLALGRYTPIYPAMVGWLPGAASVRYPVKWLLLTTWCVAVMAALGFDRLSREPARAPNPSRLRSLGFAAAAVTFLAGAVLWVRGGSFLAPAIRSVLRVPARLTDASLASGAVPTIGRSVALAALTTLILSVALRRAGAAKDEAGSARGKIGARAVLRSIAVITCLVTLLGGAWGVNPSAPKDLAFAPSPLLAAMPGATSGEYRFFGFPRPYGFAFRSPSEAESSAAGVPPDSMAWGMRWDGRTLRNGTYYEFGIHGAYDRLGDSRLDLLPGSAVAKRIGDGMPLPETMRLLSIASVRYVLAYGPLDHPNLREVARLAGESNVDVRLYENLSARPRAGLVPRAVTARSSGEAIEAIRAGRFDPASAVLIERHGGEPLPDTIDTGPDRSRATPGEEDQSPGIAKIAREDPDEVVVRVETDRPSWLVLTDTFDPSWRARIDDREVQVFRAHGMFRAVRVPPGTHEVAFTYRPASFVGGAVISILSILAGAILALIPRRHEGIPGAEEGSAP